MGTGAGPGPLFYLSFLTGLAFLSWTDAPPRQDPVRDGDADGPGWIRVNPGTPLRTGISKATCCGQVTISAVSEQEQQEDERQQ